jgi:class 3 adenylate cyclase
MRLAHHGSVTVPRAGTPSAPEAAADPALANRLPLVERAFVFLDLCGFTRYLSCYGEEPALDALAAFRHLARSVAASHDLVIDKWLGDGALLVGTELGPTTAGAAELIARYRGQPLALRGGAAEGAVVLFDGEDYIGRPANLASRLCHASHPDELLAVGCPAGSLPEWVEVRGAVALTLRGIGRLRRVQRLGVAPGAGLPQLPAVPGGSRMVLEQASKR